MLPPAQQAVKGPGGEEEIPLGEEHRRLLWGKGALKTMVDAATVVQHMVRRWSHTAQQVCYKPIGNQVFIAVLLMEQLVLDRDCPIEEVLYSSSPVPGLTGITLQLYSFIVLLFLQLWIISTCAYSCLSLQLTCQPYYSWLEIARFLLFIYFCFGNEDMVNTYTFKEYSIYSLAYTWLLRASDPYHTQIQSQHPMTEQLIWIRYSKTFKN